MTDYIDHSRIGRTLAHRSLVKACVPDGCEVVDRLPVVPMPVDINDERAFPNIAEAARHVREKGLV